MFWNKLYSVFVIIVGVIVTINGNTNAESMAAFNFYDGAWNVYNEIDKGLGTCNDDWSDMEGDLVKYQKYLQMDPSNPLYETNEGRFCIMSNTQQQKVTLIIKAFRNFASIWIGTNMSLIHDSKQHVKSLLAVNKSLTLNIFETVINEVYNFQKPEIAAYYVREIFNYKTDLDALETMIKIQLYLYWHFMHRSDVNDKYILHVAYIISKAKSLEHYPRLENNLQRRVNKFIASLPSSIQQFFFKPIFHFLNNANPGYLYNPLNWNSDSRRRFIFHWNDPQLKEKERYGYYIQESVEYSTETNIELNLKFKFKDDRDFMYLYLERENAALKNRIAALVNGSATKASEFDVDLIENVFVLSQDGSIICADNDLFDKDRRYATGSEDSNSISNEACQWIIAA